MYSVKVRAANLPLCSMTYGNIRNGYNRHDMAAYYQFQRKNMLGWDIYGNVQRFGWTPYWSGHDTNRNTEFQAGLNEVTTPWGPYCRGNLVPARIGNISTCVVPMGKPLMMPEIALWSGRSNMAGDYRNY